MQINSLAVQPQVELQDENKTSAALKLGPFVVQPFLLRKVQHLKSLPSTEHLNPCHSLVLDLWGKTLISALVTTDNNAQPALLKSYKLEA